MNHRSTVYWVEAQEGEKVVLICHSKKGNQMYHKFLDKKKALDLIKKEKAITPEVKYRLVKEVSVTERGNWQ